MSWYQLYSIYQEIAVDMMQPTTGREPPPVACPNDGTPLIGGNPLDPSVELFCPFDGWQFPRDWIRPAAK